MLTFRRKSEKYETLSKEPETHHVADAKRSGGPGGARASRTSCNLREMPALSRGDRNRGSSVATGKHRGGYSVAGSFPPKSPRRSENGTNWLEHARGAASMELELARGCSSA